MAFCRKCGKELKEENSYCPACGEPTEQAKPEAPTFSGTVEGDPADIEQNKAMAILSYFSLLVLVPIFAAKQSRFARFHANQGLVLLIAEVILGCALALVNGLIGLAFFWLPFIGNFLARLLTLLVSLAALAMSVVGIVNAVNGQEKELPLIGSFRILK